MSCAALVRSGVRIRQCICNFTTTFLLFARNACSMYGKFGLAMHANIPRATMDGAAVMMIPRWPSGAVKSAASGQWER